MAAAMQVPLYHLGFHLPSLSNRNVLTRPRCRLLGARAQSLEAGPKKQLQAPYQPGLLDNLFLHLFRKKMVQEVGWDSPKPGYDGLVEVARRLLAKYKDKADTEEATVRILESLFPPLLLPLFRALVAPIFGGKPAAVLTARVTQATCQWLMGSCTVNSVDLPDGSSIESGVLVERCKYLEESKCAGICIHTCKLPTQTFIRDYMGIPLTMEPNFENFSCQFKFGVAAPSLEEDKSLETACLEICPVATARTSTRGYFEGAPNRALCPQVALPSDT